MKILNHKINQSIFYVISLLLLIVIITGCASQPQIIVNKDNFNQGIDAAATAERNVAPNEARFTITVITKDENANNAMNKNNEITKRVINDINQKKSKSDEIKTESVQLYPQKKWDEKQKKSVLDSYVAKHVLQIKTNKIESVGELIDVAIKGGANEVSSIRFMIDDKTRKQIHNELIVDAVKNAKKKAEALAKGANVNLGSVVSINEATIYNARPIFVQAKEMNADTNVPVQAGDITVRVQVNIKYLIS